MEREFDWDPKKASQNLLKHGIDFDVAQRAFDDPFGFFEVDDRFDYGEKRVQVIGQIDDTLIVAVVFTDRLGITRLISARRASRHERRKYYSRRGAG